MRRTKCPSIILLLVVFLLICSSCGQPETLTPTLTPPVVEKTPAKFEVTSLVVTPSEVQVGQAATVTVTIENSGEAEGVYVLLLTVNGVTETTKDITVAPESSVATDFVLVKSLPGTYLISVAQLNQTLKVTTTTPREEQLYKSLMEVISKDDLDSLELRGGISTYIDTIIEAEKEIPWAHLIPPQLFRDYVLPPRFHPSYNLNTAYYYPERVENWRTPVYQKAKQIIGSESDPWRAARRLMEWTCINIPYLANNQPEYLQPTLILARQGGSCWHSATLLASLYRSVYLPARIVVGASYWSDTARASGKGSLADLNITVMERFWISRDWEIWWKDIKVVDTTTNETLPSEKYSVSIERITEAGNERLTIKIPSQIALDHNFTVTFKFAFPQGHEWVEVYIPGKGWVDADAAIEARFNQGLALFLGQFDMQAYNPASKTWESSYFFYKFCSPIDALLKYCDGLINETQQKGIDTSQAKTMFDQAKSIYNSVNEKMLSSIERQEKGQQIYELLGQAIVLCKAAGKPVKFYNVWSVTCQDPQGLASDLNNENMKVIGVLLPYNVFDLLEIRRLYGWKEYGIKPPYVNEVKREFFWVEAFRSYLSKEIDLCVIIVGYDPIEMRWKATLVEWP